MNVAEIKTRTEHCTHHGEFVARNWIGKVWSKCPACASAAAQQEREAADLRQRQGQIDAWQKRIGRAGIPERFQDRTLDNYKAETPGQQHALKVARDYAATFDRGAMQTGQSLLFIGKPGTGKTHLAVGIGMSLLQRSRPVLFTTVIRAIRHVRSTWARESQQTESEAIDTLVLPDLLILDEVGVQSGSESEKNMLFDILNERYERRRPTILLSNQDMDGVRAFLGDRVFDRLREDGGLAVAFDWDSQRGKAVL